MLSEERIWYKFEGATDEAIHALQSIAGVNLPTQYIQLLQFSDGGEGPLSVLPFNCCLDSAATVQKNLSEHAFDEFFSGFLVFGGSGGGELLALDVREEEPWPVVAIDATNCNIDESVVSVAPNFSRFLDYLGVEPD